MDLKCLLKPLTLAALMFIAAIVSTGHQLYRGILAIKLHTSIRTYSASINRAATSGELASFIKHGFDPKMCNLEWFTAMSVAMFISDVAFLVASSSLLVRLLYRYTHWDSITLCKKLLFFIGLLSLVAVHSASWATRHFGPGGEAVEEVAKLMLDGVGMVCSRPEHCRFCQTAVAEITISLDCSTFEVRDVDNRPYEHDPFAPLPDCKSPSTGTASCTSSAREILSTRRFAYFFWIARIVSIGAFIWFRSYPNNAANPANPADAADAANPNPNSNANGRVQPHEEENGIEMQGAQDVNPRQATDTPTARNDSERRVSTSSDDDDFRSATDATAAANDSGRGTSTFSDEDDSRSDITSTAAGDVSELAHASSAAGDEEFSEPMCPIL